MSSSSVAAQPTTATAAPLARPAYRPDIDGLRAIAVLLVIGFHAVPQAFPGGFVGVDVFFVISGFLISALILSRVEQGTFSLREFYVRRIKRIVPALTIVLAAVGGYGWFALLPDEYAFLGKHILAGAGFFSNVLFFREAGYFDAAADQKPLLHLWSLGVEEQFYLLWPFALMLAGTTRRRVLAVIASVAVVSFAVSVARVGNHQVETFYLPHTRFWELMLGSLLAAFQVFQRRPPDTGGRLVPATSMRQVSGNVVAASGLAMIVASAFLIDGSVLFPGWWALMPALGTALVITAGPEAHLNRVLSARGLVFVGLISYSLYLWHWPLLSLSRIIGGGRASQTVVAGAVILAFVLASVTYVAIERPIRAGRTSGPMAIVLLCGLAALGTAGLLSYEGRVAPRLASVTREIDRFLNPAPLAEAPVLSPERYEAYGGPALRLAGISRTTLLIGDSNIEQYLPRIGRLLQERPGRTNTTVLISGGGCIPVPDIHEINHPHCSTLTERASAVADDPMVTTVVIGALWSAYWRTNTFYYYQRPGESPEPLRGDMADAEGVLGALQSYVSSFVRRGKRVVILGQIPDSETVDPRQMVKRSLGHPRPRVVVPTLLRTRVLADTGGWTRRLKEIARRTGATLIDPLDTLCPDTICPLIDERGRPIYADRGHLRWTYVYENVSYLDAVISP